MRKGNLVPRRFLRAGAATWNGAVTNSAGRQPFRTRPGAGPGRGAGDLASPSALRQRASLRSFCAAWVQFCLGRCAGAQSL